jgi:hypothetical protein
VISDDAIQAPAPASSPCFVNLNNLKDDDKKEKGKQATTFQARSSQSESESESESVGSWHRCRLVNQYSLFIVKEKAKKRLRLGQTKNIFYQIDDRIQIQQSDSKVTTSPGHQRCVGHSSLWWLQ